MEDIYSCPYCQAEVNGYSEGWAMSPDYWDYLKEIHDKYHNRANSCEPALLDCVVEVEGL